MSEKPEKEQLSSLLQLYGMEPDRADRYAFVVVRCILEDQTYQSVAREMGLSRSRPAQILGTALRYLRHPTIRDEVLALVSPRSPLFDHIFGTGEGDRVLRGERLVL